MPDRDAVQQIATFGQTIGIGDLGFDDDGYCCLVIDQVMVINIELDEAAQRRLLYSVVGRPDGVSHCYWKRIISGKAPVAGR